MPVHFSSKIFIIADDISDYIPVISSINNVVDLFLKLVYIPSMEKSEVLKSYYWRTLEQKDASRCLTLLLPFIGNCIIMVYDFHNRQYNDKDYMLDCIKNGNFQEFAKAHFRLKDNDEFMLEAIKINHEALTFASDRLKDNDEFISLIIKINHEALKFAATALKMISPLSQKKLGQIKELFDMQAITFKNNTYRTLF